MASGCAWGQARGRNVVQPPSLVCGRALGKPGVVIWMQFLNIFLPPWRVLGVGLVWEIWEQLVLMRKCFSLRYWAPGLTVVILAYSLQC